MRKLRRAQERHARAHRRLRHGFLVTGTAATLSLVTQVGIANPIRIEAGDEHQIAVNDDSDSDLLTDREETSIGYQPYRTDQNANELPDGVELAARFAQAIAALPLSEEVTSPDQIYKESLFVFGQEACDICGAIVNMGSVRIVNPTVNLQIEIPVLAIHYMEHGAFSYAGDVNTGRIDIARLARVLSLRFPYDPNEHLISQNNTSDALDQILPDANDLDGDLLADSEELAAGLNLYDADQDGNLLPDGIQLAQRCAEAIDNLPTVDPTDTETTGLYKVSYMMRGLEWCEVCGESVNMGYWLIVNTDTGTSMEVSEISRHFMTHGSFSYMGTLHGAGRTDVAALLEILGLPSVCGDPGIPYDPADLNRDGQVDIEDFTEFAERWLDSTEPTDE